MAQLIDRTELILLLDKQKTFAMMDGRNKAYYKGLRDAIKEIEEAPTVARWFRCPVCNRQLCILEAYVQENNECPSCGSELEEVI